jgi:uncharacterized repeat protein (TIGR01451 family)
VRTRLLFRMTWAAVLAAVAGGGALAQTPPAPPKYYPGTIAPSPAAAPPATTPAPAAPPKPKLFSASGEGVRPVSHTEPEPLKAEAPKVDAVPPKGTPLPPIPTPTDLPKPDTLKPVPAEPLPLPAAPPAPMVTTERSAPAVTPKPLDTPTPLVSPTPPAVPPTPAGVPTAGNLSAKQAPSVSVEYEMPETVGVGQPLAYTLIVKNTGTAAVSGVRVDQELPTGVTYQSSEPPADTTTDGKLGWGVGSLDAGAEKRIKVTVKPSDEGEVRGRATVSFATAVEAKVKVTRPRIGVALTAVETVRVGEKVQFTIKLTNTGSGAASSMTLHARLTDGLTHAAGNVIEAPLANLPAGQTKTLTLECVAAKAGAQQCTLTVFADTNPGETAKVNVNLVEPQLVAKQAGPAKCLVKAEPTYQIDLSNPGTAATDPVSVWTTIPEGFEVVQASDGGTFVPTNKAVGWKLNGLTAGGSKSLTLKLRSVGPSDAVIRTVCQAVPEGKGKGLETKCETAVKAEGVPALRFEVVDVDDPVEVGKEALYEIKVTNQGTGPCTNVVVVGELGDGTSFGSASGPTTGRAAGNVVTFDALATLPVKGEAVFKVKVKGGTAGDTRFKAKVACDQIKTPVSKEENTRFYKE